MIKKTIVLTGMAALLIQSVSYAQKEKLLFQSGFEKGTKLVKANAQADLLVGVDQSVAAPNDWTKFSQKGGYPAAGTFSIFYEGGDSTKRIAKLVPDPKNPSNTVLKFTVFESNVVKKETDTAAYKTRIQGQVNGVSEGIQRYYQSVRMYFPSTTMNLLKKYPERISWYSLAEFWNNSAWGNILIDPYRLTVRMGHEPGENNPFYFHFSSDQYRVQFKEDGKTPEKYIPTEIKNASNETFQIPSDTWLTVEYYFQEGNWKATANRPAGHFYMTVQAEGGKKIVLFNERVATIHPKATVPDGLTVYHPLKFYTNKQIADYMKANNTPMEILWDDLKIYCDKIPDDEALKSALAKP